LVSAISTFLRFYEGIKPDEDAPNIVIFCRPQNVDLDQLVELLWLSSLSLAFET
jgi:hypothetical protein